MVVVVPGGHSVPEHEEECEQEEALEDDENANNLEGEGGEV